MPSSETYHALSTGVLDTMLTSSAPFVSYRLYEVLDKINVPQDYAIWYFVLIDLLVIVLLCAWPALALWLPNKMIG